MKMTSSRKKEKIFPLHCKEELKHKGWTFKVSKTGKLTVFNPEGERILNKAHCDRYVAAGFQVVVKRPVFYRFRGQEPRWMILPGTQVDHPSEKAATIRLTLSSEYDLEILGDLSGAIHDITNAKSLSWITKKMILKKRKCVSGTKEENSNVKMINPKGKKLHPSVENLLASFAHVPPALPTGGIDWSQQPDVIHRTGLLIEFK